MQRVERGTFVTDATDEKGQGTLARSLCPLIAVIDLYRGHELTDQLQVEDMWVGGHVSHTQIHEHVLEVRSNAERANHMRVDKSCWLDRNLQPLVEEYVVVVIPRV